MDQLSILTRILGVHESLFIVYTCVFWFAKGIQPYYLVGPVGSASAVWGTRITITGH